MSRSFALSLLAPVLVVVALAFAPRAHAIAQRTFVASYGLTVNTAFNCSIANPCRAFSEAIGVTSAGGEVVVLDSAGYGPVTIAKSVSIIAPAGVFAGVTVFTGNGITINGSGVSVVLRGLVINGLGGDAGIDIQDALKVRIENCVVSRMSQMGIFHRAAGQVTISDTIVRDNAQDGIRMVTGFGSIALERVTGEGNSGSGIYISPNDAVGRLDATISDSQFSRNALKGIWVDAGANATVFASIDRSTMAENSASGVQVDGSSSAILRVTVQRSTLRRNHIGIAAGGIAPVTIIVNASDNILHQNQIAGLYAAGSGTTAKASGNSYDDLVCVASATITSYQNNSVSGLPACAVAVPLQ